ncbi:triose-phosphate isomerase [Patescibacteria group bacterium]|nr:triose-phosphate isomerase [Patescibacteria group bacterium]
MKYIVANWKMHLGIREGVALARGVLRGLRGEEVTPEVVLCPPFTALSEVHKVLARSRVQLGAQNCGTERSGAFTGEVSTMMLEDVDCSYVIVGHSERRTHFLETDEIVNKKMQVVAESKLTPILCVGENSKVREGGGAHEFVIDQLTKAFTDVRLKRKQKLFIAYEPIWAIGTGEPASIGDMVEMHQVIRAHVRKVVYINEEDLLILYGGSVDADNAYQFLREREVDGLLVGGASLKLQQFHGILKAGSEVILAQQG